jgi:hypothetical protein
MDNWFSDDEAAHDVSRPYSDTIEGYFSAPLVSKEALCQGGILEYRKKTAREDTSICQLCAQPP